MNAQDVFGYLRSVEIPPTSPDARAEWVEARDVIPFLEKSAAGDIPIYFSRRGFFVYAVMVPAGHLIGDYEADLMGWNFPVSRGWSYMPHETDDAIEVVIHRPGQVVGSRVLQHAEPMIYLRHFARRVPDESYVELDQKLIHLADVHWLDDRDSFCRLNEHGDIVDAIRIYQKEPGKLCTIDIETLNRYLIITSQAMVQLFDVHRCPDWSQWTSFWGRDREENERLRVGDLIADKTVLRSPDGVDATTLRGVQIIRGPSDARRRKQLLLHTLGDYERHERFILQDWRNSRIREYPSDGNDEHRIPPPDLISPAFFRPQVLDRYKADPDKYILTQSTIECPGVWSLRSYDINDAGQVYAYLKDLWELPYGEQQYWRVFNEAPKAGISERSISQDILGKAWLGPDPLRDLQWVLRDFPRAKHDGTNVRVWSLKTGDAGRALAQLHYLHTESKKEWRDQLLELHKVVVEGLQTDTIRRVAQALNCDNPDWRSIKLLRACLQKRGVSDSAIHQVHDPLSELHQLRSHGGVAHLGGPAGNKDLRADYHRLLADVTDAMTLLADLIRQGTLDLPPKSGSNAS